MNPAQPHRINPPQRPQWLVSVQSMEEARLVAPFAVDILDWKQPAAGPLAPVGVSVWEQVAAWTASKSNDHHAVASPFLSAALGESDEAIPVASQLPECFAFAKVGPSGCRSEQQLDATWRAVRAQLPAGVELVAVAYADHQAADCLPVDAVLDRAASQGFRRILIDTFDKSSGSSLAQLPIDSLRSFASIARQRSMWWALAGSIGLADVELLDSQLGDSKLLPDCLAVRGAVCEGGRSGSISLQKLQQWQRELKQTP